MIKIVFLPEISPLILLFNIIPPPLNYCSGFINWKKDCLSAAPIFYTINKCNLCDYPTTLQPSDGQTMTHEANVDGL